MKAIVSTGFGKLYFHETARALASSGVEVNFLAGWLPRPGQAAIVDFLGAAIGEKHLARRLESRRLDAPGTAVTSIAWPEVAGTLLGLASRLRLLPRDLAFGWQFRVAALGSRKYLKDADALLVRSGAGQSGAIQRARRNGLGVVTDQSLAHPAFIHEVLREEFLRFGLDAGYDPATDIWKLVLRDCDQADLLLVNSDFVKQTFLQYGYPEEKIRVAYLGVRENFFDLKKDYEVRGPVKILFTGNFDLRKGSRILMEAVRLCRRRGLDLRVELIGNLSNGAPCVQPGDASFFTHTPFIPPSELAPAMERADLFVFPTFAEGSSRSAMEAAAAGLPIVTTKNCGLPLEHEKSALYVSVGEVEALAEAIARASGDRALRESLGRNAMRTVTENHTWRHYGETVKTTLEEAAAMRRSR